MSKDKKRKGKKNERERKKGEKVVEEKEERKRERKKYEKSERYIEKDSRSRSTRCTKQRKRDKGTRDGDRKKREGREAEEKRKENRDEREREENEEEKGRKEREKWNKRRSNTGREDSHRGSVVDGSVVYIALEPSGSTTDTVSLAFESKLPSVTRLLAITLAILREKFRVVTVVQFPDDWRPVKRDVSFRVTQINQIENMDGRGIYEVRVNTLRAS